MPKIINRNFKQVEEFDITCPKCGCLARYKKYEIGFFEDCDDLDRFEIRCPNCLEYSSFPKSRLNNHLVKLKESGSNSCNTTDSFWTKLFRIFKK